LADDLQAVLIHLKEPKGTEILVPIPSFSIYLDFTLPEPLLQRAVEGGIACATGVF
jgi:hypothetical protein